MCKRDKEREKKKISYTTYMHYTERVKKPFVPKMMMMMMMLN